MTSGLPKPEIFPMWPADAPADEVLARSLWADAATIPDADLLQLLSVSWSGRCAPFLPLAVTEGVEPPAAQLAIYAHANVLDARDLWLSAARESDLVFAESYAVKVVPLSSTVRSLLRPRSGRFKVG